MAQTSYALTSQSSNSLYPSSTGSYELSVLDTLPIEDRKKEMRQLLKLLNLAKTGQPRSVLISGEPGIGKTALVDTFHNIVREGVYCRIIDMRTRTFTDGKTFFVAMIDALKEEAGAILDDALVAINNINAELGIEWDRQDLLRSIALVKLQESIGGKDSISQERLVKAIKSSVPTAKKLQFSAVNDSIEKLVNIIVNPWLLVASNLINPMVPQVQDAFNLADRLSRNDSNPSEPLLLTASSSQESSSETNQDTSATEAEKIPTVLDIQAENAEDDDPRFDSDDEDSLISGTPDNNGANQPSKSMAAHSPLLTEGVSAPRSISKHAKGHTDGHAKAHNDDESDNDTTDGTPDLSEQMAGALNDVYRFINEAIHKLDTGLLLLVDHWDQILTLAEPPREEIKSVLVHFLRQTIEQQNTHLLVALSCRSQGESESLGGPLYGLFRNKMLLSGLSSVKRRKFFTATFKAKNIQIDDRVVDQIIALTEGNPFWLTHYRHSLLERAEANQMSIVDEPFFQKLGVQQREDLLDSALTRVQLALMSQGDTLYKVLAALLAEFGNNPFAVQQAIRELSTSQNVEELVVVDVLRHLFLQGLLQEAEQPVHGEQAYQIKERMVFDFLKEKTKQVKTEISTDDKISTLKQVIPLSLQAGELDRQKTREVISLSTSLGNDTMVSYLQTLFNEHLTHDSPLVRLTAMNNLAIFESVPSFESIMALTDDEDELVREYAYRNLAALSKTIREASLLELLLGKAKEAIDDDAEAVRLQAYNLLSRHKEKLSDVSSIFIKGLSDASEAVRAVAMENLVELNIDSPLVKSAYLDAINDDSVAVRKAACLGIQQIQATETVDTLIQILTHDPEPELRALAAESLSQLDSTEAFNLLIQQLNDASTKEPVLLSILRALSLRPGWETESLLLHTIEEHSQWLVDLPAVYWTAIRALGHVAGTQQSLDVLEKARTLTGNELTLSAINCAVKTIQTRMGELQKLEKQLALATPQALAGRKSSDSIATLDDVN